MRTLLERGGDQVLQAKASVVSARFMKSVLFGVAASDLVTRWGAAGLLLLVALGASWIPARRAARLHPMDALRLE